MMQNPCQELPLYEKWKVICYFDYNDICIGYRSERFTFWCDTRYVFGEGTYILPSAVNPIGRTAESLIMYGALK